MKQFLVSLSLATLMSACASTGDGPRHATLVDDALLAELSPASMTQVVEARSARDVAEDSNARAKRETSWAAEQSEVARAALKTSRARLDEAKLAVAVADKSGTVGQLEAAQAEYDYALANAEVARELLALRKREHEHTKLVEKHALEELRLGRATVELQKAEAVQELDRVAAQRVPVKDFRAQVRYHETEVELARVRRDRFALEVEEARREFEEHQAKAEALRPAGA